MSVVVRLGSKPAGRGAEGCEGGWDGYCCDMPLLPAVSWDPRWAAALTQAISGRRREKNGRSPRVVRNVSPGTLGIVVLPAACRAWTARETDGQRGFQRESHSCSAQCLNVQNPYQSQRQCQLDALPTWKSCIWPLSSFVIMASTAQSLLVTNQLECQLEDPPGSRTSGH